MLEAVLFDMDGTLLDSEKMWDVVLRELAAEWGRTLDATTRARVVGSSMGQTLRILEESLQVEIDPDAARAFIDRRTVELFRTELEWKPGARELLASVRDAGIPAALVTSTARAITEIALDTLDRVHFMVTVCGDEVAHNKPHPDPYLKAAVLCGADPRRCVAIEDSPTGIASAEAAGCAVIAVPSEIAVHPASTTVVRDTLAGLTIADLEDLVRR